MDILETVQQWLAQLGIVPEVDRLSVAAGVWGLFPQGRQELWRKEDVLGGVRCRVRYTFLLRQTAVPGQDTAQTLLQLQLAAGENPPKLGENDRFAAQQGKYIKQAGTGLAIYELRLIAEREETQ